MCSTRERNTRYEYYFNLFDFTVWIQLENNASKNFIVAQRDESEFLADRYRDYYIDLSCISFNSSFHIQERDVKVETFTFSMRVEMETKILT